MTPTSISKGSPPLPSSVAQEAWSFCLSSRSNAYGQNRVASFFDDTSDFCNLSACGRAFISFRTQIWQIRHGHYKGCSILIELFTGGRLPCLSTLELDLYNVEWDVEVPPILEYIVAGQFPSLKSLRLNFHVIDDIWVGPVVVRLLANSAGSRLGCLHLMYRGYNPPALESIKEAASKHPHLSLTFNRRKTL